MKKTVSFTFDIEDWFQVENLRSAFPHDKWDSQELRVEKNTYKILDTLDRYNVKSTFFVLGWIADRLPHLVETISGRGHEIACHGYSHKLSSLLSRAELKEDIYRGKNLLEDITGQQVIGYRAPSFSVNDDVMEILAELGLLYDSSYNPFSQNERYGKLSGTDKNIPSQHRAQTWEFPLPVGTLAGQSVPIAGGGYFRLMPFHIFSALARKYLDNNGYYTFYLHPWELDPQQPRVKSVRWDYRFRHYYGLAKTEEKLNRILAEFAPFANPLGYWQKERILELAC